MTGELKEAVSLCMPVLSRMSLTATAFKNRAVLTLGWGGEQTGVGLNLSLPDIWYRLKFGRPLKTDIKLVEREYFGIPFSKASTIFLMDNEFGPLLQALLAIQVNTYHLPGWTDLLQTDGWEYLRESGMQIPIPDREVIRTGGRVLTLPELITRCEVLVYERPKVKVVVEEEQ